MNSYTKRIEELNVIITQKRRLARFYFVISLIQFAIIMWLIK